MMKVSELRDILAGLPGETGIGITWPTDDEVMGIGRVEIRACESDWKTEAERTRYLIVTLVAEG